MPCSKFFLIELTTLPAEILTAPGYQSGSFSSKSAMTLMMLLDELLAWLRISHSDCDPELQLLAVIVLVFGTGDPFPIFKLSILGGGGTQISGGGIEGSAGSKRDPEDDDPVIWDDLDELY